LKARNVAPWPASAAAAKTPISTVYQSRMPTGSRALKSVNSSSENQPRASSGTPRTTLPERRAEEDRQKRAGGTEDGVPGLPPERRGDVAAELDGDAAQDERPENQHDGEVETDRPRRQHLREGEEQDPSGRQQPDLVAVPERADGRQHLRRSRSVRATRRCSAPAPRSNPSAIT